MRPHLGPPRFHEELRPEESYKTDLRKEGRRAGQAHAPADDCAHTRGEFIRRANLKGKDYRADWVYLKLNDPERETILCKDPLQGSRRAGRAPDRVVLSPRRCRSSFTSQHFTRCVGNGRCVARGGVGPRRRNAVGQRRRLSYRTRLASSATRWRRVAFSAWRRATWRRARSARVCRQRSTPTASIIDRPSATGTPHRRCRDSGSQEAVLLVAPFDPPSRLQFLARSSRLPGHQTTRLEEELRMLLLLLCQGLLERYGADHVRSARADRPRAGARAGRLIDHATPSRRLRGLGRTGDAKGECLHRNCGLSGRCTVTEAGDGRIESADRYRLR